MPTELDLVVSKYETALKLIMNILDDDPDRYAQQAYRVAAEALKEEGAKKQTVFEPADHLAFTGDGS